VKEGENFGLLQIIQWIGQLSLDNVIFQLGDKGVAQF
jgi:hypothetical protein